MYTQHITTIIYLLRNDASIMRARAQRAPKSRRSNNSLGTGARFNLHRTHTFICLLSAVS